MNKKICTFRYHTLFVNAVVVTLFTIYTVALIVCILILFLQHTTLIAYGQ